MFKAAKIKTNVFRTTWRIDLNNGKSYFAYTYPNGALICVKRSGRRVRGAHLESATLAAIALCAAAS